MCCRASFSRSSENLLPAHLLAHLLARLLICCRRTQQSSLNSAKLLWRESRAMAQPLSQHQPRSSAKTSTLTAVAFDEFFDSLIKYCAFYLRSFSCYAGPENWGGIYRWTFDAIVPQKYLASYFFPGWRTAIGTGEYRLFPYIANCYARTSPTSANDDTCIVLTLAWSNKARCGDQCVLTTVSMAWRAAPMTSSTISSCGKSGVSTVSQRAPASALVDSLQDLLCHRASAMLHRFRHQ